MSASRFARSNGHPPLGKAPLPPGLLPFAERVARSTAPVLLYGETGSGKTWLARLIHDLGPRAGKPFKRVNCGAIPETLFEREMFGHVRGAFTDAKDSQPGDFEAAHRGTLFLDEIGEMPLSVQPKLLAALEEGQIRRLGSPSDIPVDVRMIAATNRDLGYAVASGEFRRDLFYRLRYLPFHVPPLRERKEQLPEIIAYLLRGLVIKEIVPQDAVPELHPNALCVLRAHTWPGNLRELEQVLVYATTFFPGPTILPEHVALAVQKPEDGAGLLNGPSGTGGKSQKLRYQAPECSEKERRMIVDALRAEGGNRTRAAKRLRMSRQALWTKINRYGIEAGEGEV